MRWGEAAGEDDGRRRAVVTVLEAWIVIEWQTAAGEDDGKRRAAVDSGDGAGCLTLKAWIVFVVFGESETVSLRERDWGIAD